MADKTIAVITLDSINGDRGEPGQVEVVLHIRYQNGTSKEVPMWCGDQLTLTMPEDSIKPFVIEEDTGEPYRETRVLDSKLMMSLLALGVSIFSIIIVLALH